MKISREVALSEFDRFVEEMDLEFNESDFTDEDKSDFLEAREKLLKALMLGSLVIDDKGQPIYTPQRTEDAKAITFYEPDGATLLAGDKRKSNEQMAKFNMLMGSMCKVHPSVFARMKMKDYKVCQNIAMLFLA